MNVRIGTRGSALAVAQTGLVADSLRELGAVVEVITIKTSGDERKGGPAAPAGDKSRFVKEIEEALLAGDVDLDVQELRGNVDTRLRKLAEGRYDAVVLAAAGLVRLGRAGEGNPIDLTPAPGQGCLALEARADDAEIGELAAQLTHQDSLVCLTAERALVTALDASCRTPIAAHAQLKKGALRMDAFVGLPDGSTWIRDELEGDRNEPAALGLELAERLIAAGAREVLEQADSIAAP